MYVVKQHYYMEKNVDKKKKYGFIWKPVTFRSYFWKDSYPVATYLFLFTLEYGKEINSCKAFWDGGRKSDDWQITNLRWRRVNVCRSVQREGSNVIAFETERVVHEALFLN